jgi:hypothetical protein
MIMAWLYFQIACAYPLLVQRTGGVAVNARRTSATRTLHPICNLPSRFYAFRAPEGNFNASSGFNIYRRLNQMIS